MHVMNKTNYLLSMVAASLPLLCNFVTYGQEDLNASLRSALTFHATFDGQADADFSRGDRSIWQAPTMNKRAEATKGLPAGGEVKVANDSGKYGGAIRFSKSKGPMVFFKAENNIKMPSPNWSQTVSFWLSTDPTSELPDGFCDPIQITSKQWDDASMFVEFEKKATSIPFRLGVYADKAAWNPEGKNFSDIPAAERPLAAVDNPPFAARKWTHVAFVVSNFNTSRADGLAILFLDGTKVGQIASRTQTFTWEPKQAAIMLGLNYVGMMDDLALFDRALLESEIVQLYALKNGVSDLMASKKQK